MSGAAGARFSEIPFAARRWQSGREGGGRGPENWDAGGWGAHLQLGPGQVVPQNQGFLLSRMAALGVSFGLVACVLGLVLGLCFAREFPVSERPLTGHLARPRPAGPLRPSCPGDS